MAPLTTMTLLQGLCCTVLLLSVATQGQAPSTTPVVPVVPGGDSGGWGVPTEWYKEQIPNPRVDVHKCGRQGRRSWVCDPNGVLTYEDANALDQQIEVLRHSTNGCHCKKQKKCPSDGSYGGWQAGIAVLQKVHMPVYQPSSHEKKKVGDDITDYLREDTWEFGACDDDLIILLSVDDRLIYTQTGDEMSGTLTNACVDQIFNDNKNYFSDARWAEGLKNMVFNYTAALNKDHDCNRPVSTPLVWLIVAGIAAFFIISVIVALIKRSMDIKKYRKYFKAQKDKKKYKPVMYEMTSEKNGSA